MREVDLFLTEENPGLASEATRKGERNGMEGIELKVKESGERRYYDSQS